ncbi:MAG: hypothetical protein O6928_04460 [Gammaproteobacteria bacterium]|nr:hypothetical protein [Gammaproteobacteria bacterium]
MTDSEYEDDLQQDIAGEVTLNRELSFLFGEDIVVQARLLDVADLNLTDEMTAFIGKGVRQLKHLKHDPQAQQRWVSEQAPGSRLLLCLWMADMNLLEKMQTRSYL